MKKIVYYLLAIWILPIYILVLIKKNKRFAEDVAAWCEWKKVVCMYTYMRFVILMADYPEFRTICYYRLGKLQYLVRWMLRPQVALYIHCKDIGGGFRIQHGFATIITAQKIGKNAKIFQQVTIGYNGDKLPIIGDNVEICCGAKVIGDVRVGNNVTIGAQALVIHDVEDNVLVGGVPAKVLKKA